jgi:hypothetical protein
MELYDLRERLLDLCFGKPHQKFLNIDNEKSDIALSKRSTALLCQSSHCLASELHHASTQISKKVEKDHFP